MFEYKDGLQFINIETDYIKTLSVVCPEVSYKDIGYDRKPYIGVLVQNGDHKYAIPLTSAKDKHKAWKYEESDRLLVYERIKRKSIRENDIVKEPDQSVKDNEFVNRILSAIDVKKMEDVVAKNVDNNAKNSQ